MTIFIHVAVDSDYFSPPSEPPISKRRFLENQKMTEEKLKKWPYSKFKVYGKSFVLRSIELIEAVSWRRKRGESKIPNFSTSWRSTFNTYHTCNKSYIFNNLQWITVNSWVGKNAMGFLVVTSGTEWWAREDGKRTMRLWLLGSAWPMVDHRKSRSSTSMSVPNDG